MGSWVTCSQDGSASGIWSPRQHTVSTVQNLLASPFCAQWSGW